MANEVQELKEPAPARSAKDDRRDAIVAIAQKTFIANGYAGTSMSEIAARLGGSKGTLYSYFKSKEELFVAVVGRKCAQIEALMKDAVIKSGGDLKATLTDFGEHFLELVLSDDSIATFRLAIAESDRFPEIGQAIYNTGISQNLRRTTELLRHAKEASQLRDDVDVAVAAEQFLDLCLTGIHRRRLLSVTREPSAKEVRANVAHAVSTFMLAFGA